MDELLLEEVLVMYDIRGIQNYIFRTNRLKDIIGASNIVDNIISNALKEATKDIEKNKCILDWEEKDGSLVFLTDKQIQIQVLFIGGGNAYVLFRTRELCKKTNRKMARYIMDKTYSLQLAIAVVKKTDNFKNDYKAIFERMDKIKSSMPISRTLGALPIVQAELATGFPIVAEDNQKNDKISEETKLKREASGSTTINQELMVTERGKDSVIAIVHIDGNNMGKSIAEIMKNADASYENAVKRHRQISYKIKTSFEDTFKEMKKSLEEWSKTSKEFTEQTKKNLIRKIITAGDDITFVCNGKIALSLVEFFCKTVSEKSFWTTKEEEKNLKYNFSVCAGIAYINSHYPFSIGYEIAEACCKNAKKRAKIENNYIDGRIGNWVDFQICKNVQSRDLEKNRKKDYRSVDGKFLLMRPYCFAPEGRKICYDFKQFKEWYQFFADPVVIPRSLSKKIRNAYPLGSDAVETLVDFAKSRNIKFSLGIETPFVADKDETNQLARWYDPLELMDLYLELDLKRIKTESEAEA